MNGRLYNVHKVVNRKKVSRNLSKSFFGINLNDAYSSIAFYLRAVKCLNGFFLKLDLNILFMEINIYFVEKYSDFFDNVLKVVKIGL
mgnify:CR=1 FL=1